MVNTRMSARESQTRSIPLRSFQRVDISVVCKCLLCNTRPLHISPPIRMFCARVTAWQEPPARSPSGGPRVNARPNLVSPRHSPMNLAISYGCESMYGTGMRLICRSGICPRRFFCRTFHRSLWKWCRWSRRPKQRPDSNRSVTLSRLWLNGSRCSVLNGI